MILYIGNLNIFDIFGKASLSTIVDSVFAAGRGVDAVALQNTLSCIKVCCHGIFEIFY